MKELLRKIKSMIRRAVVSLSLPDDGDYPIVQIGYLGKNAKAEVMWPYGMGGRLPADAQFFCLNVEGMEENKAGIGTTPTIRFKVNEEGEVYFGNPLTGSVTYFRSNGDIEIIGKNDLSLTLDQDMNINISGDINGTISGDFTETTNGDRNIDATNVNITATTAVNVTAPAINIGSSGATLRTLIDDRFEALFNGHIHSTPAGLSGVPTVPLVPGAQNTSDLEAS